MPPDIDTVKQLSSRQCDIAVEAVFDCASEVFTGIEKVAELNVQTVKTSLSEQQALADAALAAQSLTEIVDLQSQQLPAAVTKTFAYWRHIEDIATETRAGMFEAMQERFASTLQAFVDTMDAAVPSGTLHETSDNVPLLLTAPTAASAVTDPVAIVDSSGQVVSSGRARNDLH